MDLTKYLCCVRCKGNLVKRKKTLFCEKCKKTYIINNGTSVFVNSEELSLHNLRQIEYFENSPDLENKYQLDEWHKSFIERFEENFKDVKDKVILDCGTGQGYMTIELAKRGAVLLACDLTLHFLIRLRKIAQAEGLAERILFVCCSAENLPIKDKCVDFFVLNAVLEHIKEEPETIREVNRVCKNKSGLMVTSPLFYRYLNPFLIPFCFIQDKIIGHLRRYDEKTISKKFSIFKGKIKNIYYTGHFCKILITKVLVEPFGIRSLARIGEELDRNQENKKHGASNVCVFLQRG